jgi:phosphoribosylglycinamide formyltransferase 1
MKVAVLASGNGTNLQALIDAQARGELGPARLATVGSNVPGCPAVGRAERAGVPAFVLDHRSFATRAAFDQAVAERLRAAGVELVVLAGFMRILTAELVQAHAGRMINIHPALLPAFPGLRPQRQALDQGVKFSGCTVHFVEEGTDSGPIIAQAIVPVLEGDDEASLTERIFSEEHRLLPAVVRAIAEGRVSLEGRQVRIAGGPASGSTEGPFAMTRLRSL